jgi:glycosyltransferase involved in cell wall biosynthesis
MTLPNKLFECIMAGLPVLASPLPAVADVITGYGVGRIVQSLEPAAIAEAITSVLADRDALERMHRRALDAARDEFNWEHESQTLIALYRDLVPGKAPVGGPRSQSR